MLTRGSAIIVDFGILRRMVSTHWPPVFSFQCWGVNVDQWRQVGSFFLSCQTMLVGRGQWSVLRILRPHVGSPENTAITPLGWSRTHNLQVPADITFFTTWDLWQSCVKQVCQLHFANSISSLCISVSNFGDSHNSPKFFIIIVFIMMVHDQWSLMLLF